MARVGEYRLKIYNLLYEKPICEHTVTAKGQKQSNVLILGTGWIGNEAFKASFWAGQSIDTELNITVASQNAAAYKAEVLSTKEGSYLPELKKYTEQKHYANLKFIDIDVKQGLDVAGLSPLDFSTNRYSYIIVSLGDAETNWLAASELITQIGETRGSEGIASDKIIVNVFDEFSDDLDIDEIEMLKEHGKENGIEVYFFGNTAGEGNDLDRIARNINFSYSMKYNQRVNKADADRQFEESRMVEFVNSPMDYEAGNISVVSNFIGANYACDSSYASAVHIPVKLNLCQGSSDHRNPLDIFKEAIQKKNKLYWSLVSLEHRRWNAYTVMRGFRAPTAKEEETVLYHNGNSHQAKQERLHICLCDCGDKAVLNNDFNHQYDIWLKKKCPSDYPSELDRASLRAHQLTDNLSRQIDPKDVLSLIKGNQTVYSNLRCSIMKLFNDEDCSLVLYEKSFTDARRYALSVSQTDVNNLDEADRILTPVKVRNSRIDFFGLDEQLIEMTPFALWYGIRYGTVITISDGMSTTTHDVIVPTLFCAKEAVFIGKAVNSKKYQKAITDYFENRGNNTKPCFISLTSMDMDAIYNVLKQQKEKYGTHGLVINCVPNKGYDAALAVGRLIEKYPGEITAVQYSPKKGIVSFSHDRNVGVGLQNKSYSLTEYIQLMGGRIANEYSQLYDTQEYESLLTLFRKYCVPTKYRKSDGSSSEFNTWACVSGFFSNAAKDIEFEKSINKKASEEQHYTGRFSEQIFREANLENTLNQLMFYNIIRGYSESVEQNTVTVEFDYVNPEIAALVDQFIVGQISEEDTYKSVRFIPMNGGLKIANRLVQDAAIIKPGETETHKKVKVEFLQELSRRGYIENLAINPDDTVSFAFKDQATMRLMKTQGAVFELVVYHLMRGQFDDVETGVKIAWDAEDIPPEQLLMDELDVREGYGYGMYVDARGEIIKRVAFREGQSVKNEIDIIALKGMNATMISCKTSDSDSMQWVYEIKAVSDHFMSTGVMAISSDYTNKSRASFVERAKQMGVPIWGTETLWNHDKLYSLLKAN